MSTLRECKLCVPTLQPWPVPMQTGLSDDRILLVGEAPGVEEAHELIPFVGGAGRILNAALAQAGLRRSEFFVTNVIRCRPPNNRDPLDEEIANCSMWLRKEVEQVKPTMLVALGSVATNALTGKSLEWRGSIVNSLFDIPCLVTHHPAYVARARQEFPVLVADLMKIRVAPKSYKENYLVNPPLPQARALLTKWRSTNAVLALDLETSGLDPFTDEMTGYAASGAPGEAFHYSLPHPDGWLLLKEIVETMDVCWQNNIFDRTFLELNEMKPRQPVWDTMDAMYVLNSRAAKDLDFLRSVYTGVPPYKKAAKKKGITILEPGELGLMNLKDVDVTKRVMRAQKTFFEPTQLSVLQRVLALDTQAIKMRIRGVPVSKEVMAQNLIDIGPELERLEGKFAEKWLVNPNSPKQLAELLYDNMGMPLPPKRRNKAVRSTDEASIAHLRDYALTTDATELLDDLTGYRERDKIRGTFIQGWFSRIGPDGRLHPVWIPAANEDNKGTDTGRWACVDPNMQNPPERVRNQVVTDKMFIGADFKNLEFLVMLIFAGDFDAVDAICYQGRDIHTELQEEINVTSPIYVSRIQTKTVVFGTAYGRTPNSIAKQFKVPVFIAREWQMTCFNRFPKLIELAEKHKRDFREKGYAESFFGRRKYCQTETEALNHPISSTAADITHNACLALEAAGMAPIINIHDELLCEIDEPESPEEVAAHFKHLMSSAGHEVYRYFPCTPRLSKTWQKEDAPETARRHQIGLREEDIKEN